ncbi:hypothetical protein JSMCR1_p530 (plasmid) [Escherichia coli]|nr:hypothetical protein JSMCR1_p530 [Escherichia coli]
MVMRMSYCEMKRRPVSALSATRDGTGRPLIKRINTLG